MRRVVSGIGLLWAIFLLMLIALFVILRQASTDAAWIVFSSDRTRTSQLYRIRPDGTALQRLSKTDDWYSYGTWSPDGREMVFISGVNRAYRLHKLSPNKGRGNAIGDVRFVSYPRWSPDGRYIALSAELQGRRHIFRMRSDGAELAQLTNEASFDSAPTWSVDGAWLIYSSADFNGRQRLLRMRPDGSEVTELVTGVDGPHTPSWSPDGAWIVFAGFHEAYTDIFRIRPDGTDLERLTKHPTSDFQPSWSPDGEWIVFGSARDGDEDIYRMRADGSALQQLTDHPAVDSLAHWSPIIDQAWNGWGLGAVGMSVLLITLVGVRVASI